MKIYIVLYHGQEFDAAFSSWESADEYIKEVCAIRDIEFPYTHYSIEEYEVNS